MPPSRKSATYNHCCDRIILDFLSKISLKIFTKAHLIANECARFSSLSGDSNWMTVATEVADCYYNVTELPPGGTFRFRVTCSNKAGQGPSSNSSGPVSLDPAGISRHKIKKALAAVLVSNFQPCACFSQVAELHLPQQ